MPVSSSGKQKGPQRHQNKSKFKHNPGSKLTKIINSFPINGLCTKCEEIIRWRKDFRKYKPLTVPKKCTSCEQKVIKASYHIICHPCARTRNICEKCLLPIATTSFASNEPAVVQTIENTEKNIDFHAESGLASADRNEDDYFDVSNVENDSNSIASDIMSENESTFDSEVDAEDDFTEDESIDQ